MDSRNECQRKRHFPTMNKSSATQITYVSTSVGMKSIDPSFEQMVEIRVKKKYFDSKNVIKV